MEKNVIIAVDFDGTIAEHKFPKIGWAVPGAFEWMNRFQELGAKLILWTMRNDREGDGNYLSDAVEFCKQRGVTFWAHNQNPEQHSWTQSPKAYAHVYVDDAAFGCPLTEGKDVEDRKMVDWSIVGPAIEFKLLCAKSAG